MSVGLIQKEPLKLCVGGLDSGLTQALNYRAPWNTSAGNNTWLKSSVQWGQPLSPSLQSPPHKVSVLKYVAVYLVGSPLVWKSISVPWFPSRKVAISNTAFTTKGESSSANYFLNCFVTVKFGLESEPAFLISICLWNWIKETLEYKSGSGKPFYLSNIWKLNPAKIIYLHKEMAKNCLASTAMESSEKTMINKIINKNTSRNLPIWALSEIISLFSQPSRP